MTLTVCARLEEGAVFCLQKYKARPRPALSRLCDDTVETPVSNFSLLISFTNRKSNVKSDCRSVPLEVHDEKKLNSESRLCSRRYMKRPAVCGRIWMIVAIVWIYFPNGNSNRLQIFLVPVMVHEN